MLYMFPINVQLIYILIKLKLLHGQSVVLGQHMECPDFAWVSA